MNLACTENMPATTSATRDPVLFQDRRILDNLLREEERYIPSCNYFENVQTDIEPYMRKVVTTWMLEVCEEQLVEEQVLTSAINYMDRFLCVCNIKRQQLQLLGATCLLIASKIRSTNILPIDLLSAYTDYSVTYDNIASWETLVLSKLQWDVASITGFDFVDHIIERNSWGNDSNLVRRHAHTLVSICYTEPSLIQTTPSLIAASCICSAIRGLKLPFSNLATRDVCTMTGVDPISLELLIRFIDQMVERVIPQDEQKTPPSNIKYVSNDGYESPQYGQPETPTEVDSVYF